MKYLLYNDQMWEEFKKFEYIGEPSVFTLEPGTYLFKCDGARGGMTGNPHINYGILDLDHQQKFYAVVGGNGEDPTNKPTPSSTPAEIRNTRARGGYNGGGEGGLANGTDRYYNGAGGGGASDIRLSLDSDYLPPKTTHTLPDGYDQLSYLATNKTQGVNLDYIPTGSTRIEVKMGSSDNDRKNNSSDEQVFGYRASANNKFLVQLKKGDENNRYVYYALFNGSSSTGNVSTGVQFPNARTVTLSLEINRCEALYPNSITAFTSTVNATQGQCTNPIGLFCCINEGNLESFAEMYFYEMKIFEGPKLAHWYVPYGKTIDSETPVDVSSVVWSPGYINPDDGTTIGSDSQTVHIHTDTYIPFDMSTNRVKIHIDCDDGVTRNYLVYVYFYDSSNAYIGKTYFAWVPIKYWEGEIGDITISSPFANAAYMRMTMYSGETIAPADLTSFTLSNVTYDDEYEMGVYDLVDERAFPCTIGTPFCAGAPVQKYVYHSRLNEVKYIKTIISRIRSNNPTMELQFLGFYDNQDTLIPVADVDAINCDGTAVVFDNDQQTAANLIVDDGTCMVVHPNWSDNGTDVAITYELISPIQSSSILKYTMRTGGVYNQRDPIEWSMFISEDGINWYPFDRRSNQQGVVPTTRNAYVSYNTYQRDKIIDLNMYTRIMVAGGGGGSSCQWDNTSVQDFLGYGGGILGGWVGCNGANASNNAWISSSQTGGYSFGKGGDAQNRTSGSSTWGLEGQGGGGGGWYGGYAVVGKQGAGQSYSSCNGGGGSGYVLTDASEKPTNYMISFEDVMPSLYFRNTLMLPAQAFDGASITIYKLTTNPLLVDDHLTIPYTGLPQSFELIPGEYRIKCWGGDGGIRWNTGQVGKGGYAEGLLKPSSLVNLHAYVGNSSYLVGLGTAAASKDTIFNGRMVFNVNISAYDQHQQGGRAGGGATDIRTIRDDIPVMIPHSVPDQYDQYEYSRFNTAVDTGYILTADSKIECICNVYNNGSEGQALFGVQRDLLTVYSYYYADKTLFACNNERNEGPPMTFNQKIKIVVEGSVMTIYDMDGEVLMTITSPSSRVAATYPLWIFDTGHPTGGNDGTAGDMSLYSFKIYENDELVRWYVPFTNGLYDLVTQASISISSLADGPVKSDKDVYYVEGYPTEQSLLSRIIVAGGGGGQGANNYLGGAGGGETGNSYSGGGNGTNNGPGTQTGTPAQASSAGGFGFNGEGSLNSNAYAGSGGNGWFGGNGTINSGTSDNQKGGSGGSGYVLTTDSYKPAGYIPTSALWMTEAKLTTGGNTVRGMTKIEIDVEKTSAIYIIAQDTEAYKAYDVANDEWYEISISSVTQLVFDTYGVAISEIKTDRGLVGKYRLLVYNKYNLNLDYLKTYVIPILQHVKFSEHTTAEILDEAIDYDNDSNTSIEMRYTVTGVAERRRANIDILFDMSEIPITNNTVYVVQFKIRNKPTSYYYPVPPEKTIDKVKLLYVGSSDTIPNRYKTHIGGFMPDGMTAISIVNNSSSCEYKRNIYTASLINDSVIRITRFNIIENKAYIIRDNIPRNTLDASGNGYTGGSLLADDNYLYLVSSCQNNTSYPHRILRIPYNPDEAYTTYTAPTSNNNYSVGCYGKAMWLNNNMIVMRGMNALVRFNTETRAFSAVADTETGTLHTSDFCVGKYSIISFNNSSSATGVRIFDKETLQRVASPTYPVMVAGIKVCCANDDLFYITCPTNVAGEVSSHLYIMRDTPEHNLELVKDVLTPYVTLVPKTIIYTNNLLYITCASSSTLYIYSIPNDRWATLPMPFNQGAYGNKNWYRPAAFKGFFFIGHLKLFVTNYDTITKYRIGQKSHTLMIQTNDTFEGTYTYDDRYITIDETGINVHTGYFDKQLEVYDASNNIFISEEFERDSDYKRIISYGFTMREEEEEDNGQE